MALIGSRKHLEVPAFEFVQQTFDLSGIGPAPQFQARTWRGKLLKSDDRQTLPICWHAGSLLRAFGTSSLDDVSATFVSDNGDFILLPENYFGRKGSLVRVPRAVLISGKGSNGAGFDDTDAQNALLDALAPLAQGLGKLGVMVASTRNFAAFTSDYEPLAYGIPFERIDLLQQFTDDFGTSTFSGKASLSEKWSGGEVLMIEDVVVFGGYLTYQQFVPGPGPDIDYQAFPLTDVLAQNTSEVQLNHPRFARVEKHIANFDFPNDTGLPLDPNFPYAEAIALGASLLQGGCSALASYGVRYYHRGVDSAATKRDWYANMVPQLIGEFFNL